MVKQDKTATLREKSNPKAALRLDMQPRHFTPGWQLETGVPSTTAPCNNNPGILPNYPLHLTTWHSLFTGGRRSDRASTELMRSAGWCERRKRGWPKQCPLMAHPTLLPTSGLVLWWSCHHPQTCDSDDITWWSLMGCSERPTGWLISHDLQVYKICSVDLNIQMVRSTFLSSNWTK